VSETALPRATASLFCLRIIISVHSAGGKSEQVMHTFPTPRTFLLYANGLPFRPLPYGEGIIVKNLLFTFLRISYVCAKGGVPDIPAEKCHLRIPVFFLLVGK